MWGMSSADTVYLVLAMLTDVGDIVTVPDRTHQGVLNHLMVVKLLMGAFANDPNVIFNGASVIDQVTKNYWGISQGGILVRCAACAACALARRTCSSTAGVPVLRPTARMAGRGGAGGEPGRRPRPPRRAWCVRPARQGVHARSDLAIGKATILTSAVAQLARAWTIARARRRPVPDFAGAQR